MMLSDTVFVGTTVECSNMIMKTTGKIKKGDTVKEQYSNWGENVTCKNLIKEYAVIFYDTTKTSSRITS